MELKSRNKIILVGDKVLLAPDKESERTNHGLYLPPGVKEKDKVQSGYVVRIGPGYAVPNPQFMDQESWSTTPKDPIKYLPLQAEEGDYAIFIRDAAIEVEFEGEKYLIVSHSSILMLLTAQQQRFRKINAHTLVAETIDQLKQKSSPKLRRIA